MLWRTSEEDKNADGEALKREVPEAVRMAPAEEEKEDRGAAERVPQEVGLRDARVFQGLQRAQSSAARGREDAALGRMPEENDGGNGGRRENQEGGGQDERVPQQDLGEGGQEEEEG